MIHLLTPVRVNFKSKTSFEKKLLRIALIWFPPQEGQ